ncbi:class I SAM-dependent methyltransferase [Scytonema sp. UIC 10036]|uniref:class I SAM-dependent methyltransferase n=1 Tax=Scytonema sp. UIC 10036 TaxID=2304196 RepID=UPI001FAAB798
MTIYKLDDNESIEANFYKMAFDYQLKYWNSLGLTKTFSHPVNFEGLKQLVNQDARILDYGCGYGRITNTLVEHGYQYVEGVDFSERMIEKGRCLYPHLNLKVVLSPRLPYVDGEFDAVLLFTVLTCIPHNQAQIALIQELNRILKSGGLLYISDLCLQTDERNLKRYDKFKDKYGIYGIFELPENVVLRHHDLTWIKFLTSGFEQIKFEEFNVVTMNNNRAKAFQLFARKPKRQDS